MKDTFYFPHDQNAHSDPKIMSVLMRVGLSGIWLYWVLIEILHEQEDGYITYDQFKDYVNWYCSRENESWTLVEQMLNIFFDLLLLVRTPDDLVTSNRVIKNKSVRDEIAKKRSDAGKASAQAKQQSTSVQQNSNKGQQGKERKGKEIKEKETETQVPVRVFSFLSDFWEPYPKKTNQLLSEDLFAQLTPTESQELSVALPQFLAYWQGIDVKFVPAPDKFLTNKKWRDQLPVSFTKIVLSRVQKADNVEATRKQQEADAKNYADLWERYDNLSPDDRNSIETQAQSELELSGVTPVQSYYPISLKSRIQRIFLEQIQKSS